MLKAGNAEKLISRRKFQNPSVVRGTGVTVKPTGSVTITVNTSQLPISRSLVENRRPSRRSALPDRFSGFRRSAGAYLRSSTDRPGNVRGPNGSSFAHRADPPHFNLPNLYSSEATAGGLRILFSWTALLLAAGLATFAFTASPFNSPLSQNDSLSLMTLSFLCLLAAGGFIFLARKWTAARCFPPPPFCFLH